MPPAWTAARGFLMQIDVGEEAVLLDVLEIFELTVASEVRKRRGRT